MVVDVAAVVVKLLQEEENCGDGSWCLVGGVKL